MLCIAAMPCGAQDRIISLDECITLSHSNNPQVVNAGLDKKAARAQRKEVLSNWFPSISASAYGFQAVNPLVDIGLKDVLGSSDAANNFRYYAETSAGLAGMKDHLELLQMGYTASLNLTQPVFAGGRIANGNALAALGVRAADIKNDIALRDNDDAVVRKYWTVVSLSEKKKALQAGIDLVKSLEKDVASAVKSGLALERDLLQVRLKAKELETDMIRLRGGEKLAKMDLFNLIGLEYSVLHLDEISLADDYTTLDAPEKYYRDESEVASSLDETKLLDMSVKSKKIEKKMALGEGLPQVGVGATVGYGKVIGDSRPNAIVYAMVKIPLSDWGKTSRKMQRLQYEVEKAENDKAYLEKQLLLKVNKEWIDLQSAWEQKLSAEDALELAELLERQKRAEFDAGLCTLSELLQSQTELQAARSSLVDKESEYVNALNVWNNH